ncbi:MAG: hypothetical protein CMN30_12685 [Sandaracinus sp.]|nr:hypothetical protein [Sandaracinus sp.]|tara:strand:- start:208 stop:645 length:438 start_codon:yes stop_codon:yes gene_type:complete
MYIRSMARRRKPKQARSKATVDAIVEATGQMLAREGSRATATGVAERAGVSVGSLYQYFPNKKALIDAFLERRLDRMVAVGVALLRAHPEWLGDRDPELVVMVAFHALRGALFRIVATAPEKLDDPNLVALLTDGVRGFVRPPLS